LSNNCPFCEKPVEPDFLACPHCGETLKFTCPSCQMPTALDWKTCPACGAELPVDQMTKVKNQFDQANQEREKKKTEDAVAEAEGLVKKAIAAKETQDSRAAIRLARAASSVGRKDSEVKQTSFACIE
jgi:predicted amidophosphoribosyltransferase